MKLPERVGITQSDLLMAASKRPHGITAIIPACRAGDRGSTPLEAAKYLRGGMEYAGASEASFSRFESGRRYQNLPVSELVYELHLKCGSCGFDSRPGDQ